MSLQKSDIDNLFLSRFQSGDEVVFEKIFKSWYNQINGFCLYFLGEPEKAAGISQEAFINLWLNRQKIETLNGISSFLYTNARSVCLNYIRHKRVVSKYNVQYLQEKEDQLNKEVLESFDFNSLEYLELEEIINQSIAKLPEKCRRVFTMSRMEGKKNKEIAEELQISVKAVEADITRALKIMRADLPSCIPVILAEVILTLVH